MTHPYKNLNFDQYWSSGMAEQAPGLLCPARPYTKKLKRTERVATLGSCFAQHIGRNLESAGFNFLKTETAPDWMAKDYAIQQGYEIFSGRYGNVYTPRQAVQLFTRAFGQFKPLENVWASLNDPSRVVDPFRPGVQISGFSSAESLAEDREVHFAAVRKMFQSADWFVLTLGLTEAWQDLRDGAIFPIAPGISAGKYDANQHGFVNFNVSECINDLQLLHKLIGLVNPSAQIILTVSPVALSATYEQTHVWQATTYSKSVLRVAAETLCSQSDNVSYFPAYEIITSPLNGNRYLADDMRRVNHLGVNHVMRAFFKTYVDVDDLTKRSAGSLESDMLVHCDEQQLDVVNKHPTLKSTASDFDERAYLEANPDVAMAIKQGQFSSARQHYEMYGRFEGRGLTLINSTNPLVGKTHEDSPCPSELSRTVQTPHQGTVF